MPSGCRSVEKDGLAACKLIGSFHPLIVRDGRENDKEARVFTPALTTIDTGLFIFYNQAYCDMVSCRIIKKLRGDVQCFR